MTTKFCDCNQGRLPCSCKDPVGEVIAEDVASRQVPTLAQRQTDIHAKDQAEAAALQSWLVGNARIIRPVDGSALMAWALVALRHQHALLVQGASGEVEAHLERQADILRIDLNAALAREAQLQADLTVKDQRVDELEGLLRRLERANDKRASLTTGEAYTVAVRAHGMSDALLELDNARAAVRAALKPTDKADGE